MLGDHHQRRGPAIMPRLRGKGTTVYRGESVAYGRVGNRSDEEGSGIINSVGLIILAPVLVVVLGGAGVARRERMCLRAVAGLAVLTGIEQSAVAG